MRLLDMLRKVGDRLGIIELAAPPQTPSAPIKIVTRTITLSELVMRIRVAEVRDLAEPPAELSASFEDVCNAAGIKPATGGWTIERLHQFLTAGRMRKMDRAQAQSETLRVLAGEKVDPADLVKDAVSRDQALDAFETSIAEKRQQWIARKKQSIGELEAQIQAIRGELTAEEGKWKEWRRSKRQREKEMAYAVGYLIEGSVISIDDE